MWLESIYFNQRKVCRIIQLEFFVFCTSYLYTNSSRAVMVGCDPEYLFPKTSYEFVTRLVQYFNIRNEFAFKSYATN